MLLDVLSDLGLLTGVKQGMGLRALAVEGVDDGGHPNDLDIPAGELQSVGAPAQVGGLDHDLAVMDAPLRRATQSSSSSRSCPMTLDINPFKRKSVSAHWEFMFTRSMFGAADIAEQGALLNEVSRLVDDGTIRTTLAENFEPINAVNLKRAHAQIETGTAKGKIALEEF